MSEPAATLQTRGFSAAGASHRGRVRTSNEDRYHVDGERGIFLVADGVGGHAAGEIAASIAVEVIARRLERPMWTAKQRAIREAIALANNEIFRQAEASPAYNGMTCVLTLALLKDGELTIGHVGDSRLYLLTPDGIRKLTHDHSPVGEREDANEISEAEAMQHPRRNEVFRDVGSAFHEPEDPDFIEIVEAPFDDDCAIIVCSDGLSDMVPSASVERIARQHAGDPRAVVESLIDAANDAGGKDNVTVVYVEGSDFGKVRKAETTRVPRGDGRRSEGSGVRTAPTASLTSRIIWLTAGVVAGVLLAFALDQYTTFFHRPFLRGRGQTMVVGGTAAGAYATIGEAIAAASARDIVQVEPGEYAEAVTLKDGVDLVARVPGSVTLVAAAGNPSWTSLTASGRAGNRIEGIRIVGRAQAPIGTGVHLTGHNLVVDDLHVEGAIGVGVSIASDGAILIRSSRLSNISGVPMRIAPSARPKLRQNVFSGNTPVGVQIGEAAVPEFVGNVFVGFQEAVEAPVSRWPHFVQQNYVIRGAANGR